MRCLQHFTKIIYFHLIHRISCVHAVFSRVFRSNLSMNPSRDRLRRFTCRKLIMVFIHMLGPKATKNCLENLATNENGNRSSFQLANRAPPLGVTGSPIAPSARIHPAGAKISYGYHRGRAMWIAIDCISRRVCLAYPHNSEWFLLVWRSPVLPHSYLLGLLAMIKCSICSYQCDSWYSFN